MGSGDGLNRMIEKLKKSMPDKMAVTKACEGSYDLGRDACSNMSEAAKKLGFCPTSQSAAKAAAYVGAVVVRESINHFPGGPIIHIVARDGLDLLIRKVRPPDIDAVATKEELTKINEKQEADEGESLISKNSKSDSQMIKRIKKLEEDKHMLMKRIEKLEDDNKPSRSELNKFSMRPRILMATSKL